MPRQSFDAIFINFYNLFMIIRPIEDKDIKKCLDIYNYYIKNTTVTFEEAILSLDIFKDRVKNIIKDYPFLILEDNNDILGYAYLDKLSSRSAYRYTADLSIYLDNKSINKGYGKLLLDEIENKARECNIKNIISIVTSENFSSINFHLKNGFIEVGRLNNVGYKFNKYLSVVYYQKSL